MFTPITFTRSGVTAPNHFVRSATVMVMYEPETGRAILPKAADYFAALAAGRVGTIIMDHTYVHEQGKAHPGQMGISTDEHIADHAALVRAMRAARPECVVVCQLAHAGDTGCAPDRISINTATPEQRGRIPGLFADAAERAFRAGYNGVQIHSAHSYFLSSSISPIRNRRTDEYGPAVPPECRTRMLDEVIAAVRARTAAYGPDFLVGVKLQSDELQEDGSGITPEVAATVAERIAPLLNFIEISGGAPPEAANRIARMTMRPGKDAFYYRDVLQAFLDHGVDKNTTVIVTGGLRTKEHFEAALAAGAHLVGASRQFLRCANTVRELEEGRTPPECTGCNGCCKGMMTGGATACVFA